MNFTLQGGRSFSQYFGGIYRAIFPRGFGGGLFGNSWWGLGSQKEKWIDTNDLWDVYAHHPVLNNTINLRADLLSQGRIRLRKKKSKEEVFEHEVLTLLAQPNPLQSGKEFITMYSVYKDIWANALILENKGLPSAAIPNQLWNLPGACLKVKETGKLFKQLKIGDIILEYTIMYNGSMIAFKPEEIIFKNDNIGASYTISESKICAQVKPLSNIEACLRTANILIGDHGAYGIISGSIKDSLGGAIPFAGKEKESVEQALKDNYGNKPGQKQMIVSGANITYTPIGSVLNDMNLPPQVEQDAGLIYDAYGVDRNIFSGSKDSTYENKNQGRKATIQNTIQQEGDDLMETLNTRWLLSSQDLELFMTFDHLPIMQEDATKKADAFQKNAQAISILIQCGAISPAQGNGLIKQVLAGIYKIDDTLARPDDKWYLLSEPKNILPQTQNTPPANG